MDKLVEQKRLIELQIEQLVIKNMEDIINTQFHSYFKTNYKYMDKREKNYHHDFCGIVASVHEIYISFESTERKRLCFIYENSSDDDNSIYTNKIIAGGAVIFNISKYHGAYIEECLEDEDDEETTKETKDYDILKDLYNRIIHV